LSRRRLQRQPAPGRRDADRRQGTANDAITINAMAFAAAAVATVAAPTSDNTQPTQYEL